METTVIYDDPQSGRSLKRSSSFLTDPLCDKLVLQACAKLPRRFGGVDRISSLPDVILTDILSLLPTKQAVATTVLSKRWRHVFSWITALDFHVSPISHCLESIHNTQYLPIFINFVDTVLKSCLAENISTFRLNLANPETCDHECDHFCYPALEPLCLTQWIRFPLSRSVRELDLFVNVRYPSNNKLPSEIFCCATLEVLRIDSNLMLEFPNTLCLPNLKVLHLNLYDLPEGRSLARLVSSCPSLQDLVLKGEWTNGDSLIISAPSLRRLGVVLNITAEPGVSQVVLDTPKLEYLDYLGDFALEYSIASMNALVEACLHLHYYHAVEPDVTLLRLLTSFAHVCTLSLMHQCTQGLELCLPIKQHIPVFHNLRHLQLGCFHFIEWRLLLLDLLDCAPFLETLAFGEGLGIFEEDCEFDEIHAKEHEYWSTIERVPSCVRFHLRSVVVEHYDATELNLTMIKYFLRSALQLKELVVGCCDLTIPELIELQNLPRSSVICSVTSRSFTPFRFIPDTHGP